MPEEILFEIPEIRIITERLMFCNATLEVSDIDSTDVSERRTMWEIGVGLAIVGVIVHLNLDPLLIIIVSVFTPALPAFFSNLFPKKHVLTITMKDKMFYEVITRTREEAEIIQRCVYKAVSLLHDREIALKWDKTAGFSKEKWQFPD